MTIQAFKTLANRQSARKQVAERCTSCGICQEACSFLQTYGTPEQIAMHVEKSDKNDFTAAFECSLCALCSAVCPEQLDPRAMFLEIRREAVQAGRGSYPEHAGLLGYERTGTSRRFTWYGLPRGCDTVFFPGCALPGTRPKQTKKIFALLRESIPTIGIVLDCCTKPSHDLGRQDRFLSMFGELLAYLRNQGITRVLTACPNCHAVFRTYAPDLAAETVYEVLAVRNSRCIGPQASGIVAVHDSCAVRFDAAIHDAVRQLVASAGLDVVEMPHSGIRTLCCGEGAGVAAHAPHFADAWCGMRQAEAAERPLVTYCAGCAHRLASGSTVGHLVDIVLDPAQAISGKAPVSAGPLTYLNRLLVKRHFRKTMHPCASRERTFRPEKGALKLTAPILLLCVVATTVIVSRLAGVSDYLETERLRALISSYGPLAPVVYMTVYALAPSLFLPGLPITIVGGVLFGPFWGVVYTITGATAGACVAFLISRYATRDIIETKLAGSRWRRLESEVEKHGWKVVAFTRLIPLFPFNLLNYALGLTKISFVEYALTTFICMLPACIAFIVFSSSLLDLLRGRISGTLLLGMLLIVLVSLIPLGYRRWAARRKGRSHAEPMEVLPRAMNSSTPETPDKGPRGTFRMKPE